MGIQYGLPFTQRTHPFGRGLEWYAKDTSKKICAVMKSKGQAGEVVKRIQGTAG